jgi:hypothetical protein
MFWWEEEGTAREEQKSTDVSTDGSEGIGHKISFIHDLSES